MAIVRDLAVRLYHRLTLDPASPRPLALLRLGFTALLLIQALLLPSALLETHGSKAILQGALLSDFSDSLPSIDWVVDHLGHLGISEFLAIRLVYATYLAALLALTLGWHTRLAGMVAWATHLLLFPSWHVSAYGFDQFATITLFYLMVMPVGHALSLDALSGRVDSAPSWGQRLSLTVLRLQLCAVYLSSGLAKASGEQWQNGEAIWRSLMQPQFSQLDTSWLAAVPLVAQVAAWGTVLIEVGYVVFTWLPATRRLWVLLTVSLHLGIALFLGIYLFGGAMIILTVAAFGVSAEPGPVARPWLRGYPRAVAGDVLVTAAAVDS